MPLSAMQRVRNRTITLAVLFALASACTVGFVAAPLSPLPAPIANEALWRPQPGLTWQWQLTTPVDLTVDAEVFNIDLFDNAADVVAALQAKGRRVICYISAGSLEAWRSDASQFPAAVLGKPYPGWPGERWLDIRRMDLLGPIMLARLDLCRDKGFDGVEFDNVDGYTNDTGFALTAADQLRYNAWLANEARKRGLSPGLKNTPGQTLALLPYFEWALVESCLAQGWCATLEPFIKQGKAVFAAEYMHTGVRLADACAQARALQLSLVVKKRELDAYREDCRQLAGQGR